MRLQYVQDKGTEDHQERIVASLLLQLERPLRGAQRPPKPMYAEQVTMIAPLLDTSSF